MGDLLKQITEILQDGADYEQQRSTGIIIKSKVNWFDAVDGQGAAGYDGKESKRVDVNKKRTITQMPNITDIP